MLSVLTSNLLYPLLGMTQDKKIVIMDNLQILVILPRVHQNMAIIPLFAIRTIINNFILPLNVKFVVYLATLLLNADFTWIKLMVTIQMPLWLTDPMVISVGSSTLKLLII